MSLITFNKHLLAKEKVGKISITGMRIRYYKIIVGINDHFRFFYQYKLSYTLLPVSKLTCHLTKAFFSIVNYTSWHAMFFPYLYLFPFFICNCNLFFSLLLLVSFSQLLLFISKQSSILFKYMVLKSYILWLYLELDRSLRRTSTTSVRQGGAQCFNEVIKELYKWQALNKHSEFAH